MNNPIQLTDPIQPDNANSHSEKAADIARQRIESLHANNPINTTAASTTSTFNDRPDPLTNRTAYEQWYYRLTAAQQQAEWDKYYSKNEQPQTQHITGHHAVSQQFAHEHITPDPVAVATVTQIAQQPQAVIQPKPMEVHRTQKKTVHRKINPFRSLLTAGGLALILLFAFYNQIIFGQVKQYLSPASTVSTPIIIDPSTSIDVGPESRIIIPKINVDVPVVYDLGTLEESAIQEALNDGVVDYDYPGTVNPGEIGNNVIVGHSSNNFLNSGKYKFAFVLLDRLEEGDTFMLHHKGERFVYKVTTKKVIDPSDFSLITDASDKPVTTLITCTPPGTSWKRLIIQGVQITPNPESAKTVKVPTNVEVSDTNIEIPSNAPSLWQRITDNF